MAYLKFGDIRKFETPDGDYVGMVYGSFKVPNTVPEKFAYKIVTTSGIITKLMVGKGKYYPAKVSDEVKSLLIEMCEICKDIDDTENQVFKLTEHLSKQQKKRAKLWDDLADIHYGRK